MEHCKCRREIESGAEMKYSTDGLPYTFYDTTCSSEAFARGSGQKVVSFALFGDIESEKNKKQGYYVGVKGNLDLMEIFYPGWIMRVYHEIDKSKPFFKDFCKLACNRSNIDVCFTGKLPGSPMINARRVFPMNWRFFPSLDPQVDVMVSRDLDSRFSWRELSAVAQWLESDQPIHIIRDHKQHNVPIMGGAWGSHQLHKEARSKWKNSWEQMFTSKLAWESPSFKGVDQKLLEK